MNNIQRVICAPLNYSHKQEGQIDAFVDLVGADNVREFDFYGMRKAHVGRDEINQRLIDLVREFEPDWIWFQIQCTQVIDPAALALIKNERPNCIITHWMGDLRQRVPDELATISRIVDATLISSIGQIPMYRAAGAKRVEYVQIGLDYKADVLGEYAWDSPFEKCPDVVFVGNYYGDTFAQGSKERVEAIRFLRDKGIDIGVVGSGAWPDDIPVIGCCHVKQQHHVYRRSKIALSINHFNDVERYYSDRQLIAMASGTPVVCRYVPGLEAEFTDGRDCLFWRTHEQLLDGVERLLADRERAIAIGSAGRYLVKNEHTWNARVRKLAPMISQMRA